MKRKQITKFTAPYNQRIRKGVMIDPLINYDLNAPLHARKINSFKTHNLNMHRGTGNKIVNRILAENPPKKRSLERRRKR